MALDDMMQYLGVFLEEANEQLELLERAILALETGATTELLQEIFRVAHTLKGSSRAMGFTSMGELTHAMEDVLDRLRNDELAVTPAIVDALFAGLDLLKTLKDEIAAAGSPTTPTDELTARLRAVMEEGDAGESAPVPVNTGTSSDFVHAPLSGIASMAVQEAVQTGLTVYRMTVRIADDCAMKSVRALMTLNALESVGSILATTPDEDGIENETFTEAFGIILATQKAVVEVEQVILAQSEIASVTIEGYEGDIDAAAGKQVAGASSGFVQAPLSSMAQIAAQEAVQTGLKVYALAVRVADDCAMKSVRALMTLNALESVGSILATTPDEDGIENEAFTEAFGVILATQHEVAEIEQVVLAQSEITSVAIEGYSLSSAEDSAKAPKAAPVDKRVETGTQGEQRVVDLGPAARGTGGESGAEKRPAPAAGPTQAQTVRVDVTRLDNLLNLVGELVIDQTRIAQVAARLQNRRTDEANMALMEHLNEATAHFGRITSELQSEIMKARMLPIENLFNRFPRMIRDLAQKLGKELDFVISGQETELDRSVIEVIGDPLIHMLRNSVDHGIEKPEARTAAGKPSKGTVWLRARHEENYIVIEIEDDGNGIHPDKMRKNAVKKGLLTPEAAARLSDREAVHLIFASGFSTAEAVTDVSGRGVGMDIVRNNLTRFGAILDIDSRPGLGATFTIKLPLTLAIIRGLLVRVGAGVYVAPLASVVETVQVPESQIHLVNHREVTMLRGKTLPLVRLDSLFYGKTLKSNETHAVIHADKVEKTVQKEKSLYVIVAGVGTRQVGLIVESLLGEQEIVIKSLGKTIGDIRGISGATILGDGSIALIMDMNGLLAVAAEEKVVSYAA